jgi:protein SCO1/2
MSLAGLHPAGRFRIGLLFITLLPAALAQTGLPAPLQNVGIDQKLNERVPLDLRFRDETGVLVPIGGYFHGKPVVLSLVYYQCPMLCTEVLNGLLRSLRVISLDVGKDFEVVSVSIDPSETAGIAAGKKQKYVERYGRNGGAAKGWHFLTGDEQAIAQIANAVGFRYAYDARTKQFSHAAGIMVLTPEGVLSRYLYGIEYSAKDLRLSLVEAAANRIGSLADRILLFCFHYDPQTGKYSVAVMKILRLLGVTTVLALGTFLFTMVRRDTRLKREV